MFDDTNVFTSFAVPPEDDSLPFSYLPVPSMDILRHELQDRIKVRITSPSLPNPHPHPLPHPHRHPLLLASVLSAGNPCGADTRQNPLIHDSERSRVRLHNPMPPYMSTRHGARATSELGPTSPTLRHKSSFDALRQTPGLERWAGVIERRHKLTQPFLFLSKLL